MTKMRLQDSDRWREAWFMGLPSELKLLWVYICDNIDNAAVWPVNKGLAEYQIGSRMDWGLALDSFGKQVIVLASGEKWYLPAVLGSQQPGGIGTENKVHLNIRKLLISHAIDQKVWPGGGLVGALQGPLPTLPTSPLPSQDSSWGSAEGVAPSSALESNLEVFTKFLTKMRLAHGADEAQEWWSFAGECGAMKLALKTACIESVVRKARQDGVKVRYVSHVEHLGPGWKKWNETRETERISKESA